MFSKSCEYAIRASIYIAARSKKNERVSIKEIYRCIDAPESFTGKILQLLSNGNIISSAKGPNGGFFATEDQQLTKLIDIVNLIDGNDLFSGCGLGLKSCSDETPCPLHEDFNNVRSKIKSMLEENTLSVLSNRILENTFFLREFNVDLNKECLEINKTTK